jgi:hypothetical protein
VVPNILYRFPGVMLVRQEFFNMCGFKNKRIETAQADVLIHKEQ